MGIFTSSGEATGEKRRAKERGISGLNPFRNASNAPKPGASDYRGYLVQVRSDARSAQASSLNSIQATPRTSFGSQSNSRPASKAASLLGIPDEDQDERPKGWWNKRVKRSGSKLSLASSFRGSEQADTDAESTALHDRSAAPTPEISHPRNFHHVTHIGPEHFSQIRTQSENDLIAEFSAVRASQTPRRHLHGIKVGEISSPGSSVDETFSVPSLASESSRSSISMQSPKSTAYSSKRNSAYMIRTKDSFSVPFKGSKTIQPNHHKSLSPTSDEFHAFDRAQETRAWATRSPIYWPRDADGRHTRDSSVALSEDSRDPFPGYHAQTPEDNEPWYPRYEIPTIHANGLESVGEEPGPCQVERSETPINSTNGRSSTASMLSNVLSPPSVASQRSSRTITPTHFHSTHPSSDQGHMCNRPLRASQSMLLNEQRSSIVRSSLLDGLFSSWVGDDSSDDGDAATIEALLRKSPTAPAQSNASSSSLSSVVSSQTGGSRSPPRSPPPAVPLPALPPMRTSSHGKTSYRPRSKPTPDGASKPKVQRPHTPTPASGRTTPSAIKAAETQKRSAYTQTRQNSVKSSKSVRFEEKSPATSETRQNVRSRPHTDAGLDHVRANLQDLYKTISMLESEYGYDTSRSRTPSRQMGHDRASSRNSDHKSPRAPTGPDAPRAPTPSSKIPLPSSSSRKGSISSVRAATPDVKASAKALRGPPASRSSDATSKIPRASPKNHRRESSTASTRPESFPTTPLPLEINKR